MIAVDSLIVWNFEISKKSLYSFVIVIIPSTLSIMLQFLLYCIALHRQLYCPMKTLSLGMFDASYMFILVPLTTHCGNVRL